MKKIRTICIILTVAAMLISWPIHPIRKVQEFHSGNEGHVNSEPLAVGDQATQRFRATDNNIRMLEFVVGYDETKSWSGHMLFELLDADDEVIYSETLDCSALQNQEFAGVVLNQRLKVGRMYSYRLTNIDITENQPCLVYVVDKDEQFLWSDTLTVDGTEIDGEALTRITSNSPLPWADRLSIWGCIGVVGFTLSEIIGKIGSKRKQA